MWQMWRFRPRPLLRPQKWPWHYYAWRFETYAGLPMQDVTWRTVWRFVQEPQQRRALYRYIRWVGHMRRLRRF